MKLRTSPSRKFREKRNVKIIETYKRLEGFHCNSTDLYAEVAGKVGCSLSTVIRVLKREGLVKGRKQDGSTE